MAGKIVKYINETFRKQSIFDSLRAGGWRIFIDGNIAETAVVHGPGGTLKGTDQFGNRYYERMTENFGRHRWVVYGDLTWPSGQDPTTIPPEWHGWINHINDFTPTDAEFKRPIFAIMHKPFKTGTDEAYVPKGSWKTPNKRNWTKIQTWQPTSK